MASVYLIKPHIKKCPTTAIIASSPHKGQFSVYYYLHKTLWCCVFFLENEWKWLYGSCDIFQVDFLQCVRSSERKIGFCCRTLPRPPQGHHCSLGKIYEKMFGIRRSLPTMSECASSINCGLNFYNKKHLFDMYNNGSKLYSGNS